jgi:hypothetical protein
MANNLPINLNKVVFICAVCGSVLNSYFHCINLYCPRKEPDLPANYMSTSNVAHSSQTVSSSASVTGSYIMPSTTSTT